MLDSLFLTVAQATGGIDPSAVSVSITSLLGSLGAAGAAVAVTYYFLVFLKDQSEKQNRLFADFKDYQAESQKKFQEQLDRLSDRQEQSQRGFQEQVARITETQQTLLRDAVMAMKAVEKTQDGTSDTVRGIEKTVTSLQAALGAIDILVHRTLNPRPQPGAKKSSLANVAENG